MQRQRGSESSMTQHVKILFRLEPDEDGFPPISVESLNAIPVSRSEFRLENAPFFVRDISYGCLVRANPSELKNSYEFQSVSAGSEFTSISIILLDPNVDDVLMKLLKPRDCVIEYGKFGELRMLAAAIPPSGNYPEVRDRLTTLEEQGMLSFAELGLPAGE